MPTRLFELASLRSLQPSHPLTLPVPFLICRRCGHPCDSLVYGINTRQARRVDIYMILMDLRPVNLK